MDESKTHRWGIRPLFLGVHVDVDESEPESAMGPKKSVFIGDPFSMTGTSRNSSPQTIYVLGIDVTDDKKEIKLIFYAPVS